MPALIACPQCQKQYKLPETILGKSVRCKQCGTAFVAQPQQASRVAASSPSSGSQLSPRQLQQFGIEGNLQKEADIFDVPPPSPAQAPGLGNFAGEDPGFGGDDLQVPVTSASANDNANPYAAVLDNPALRSTKKKKRKGKSQLAEAERIREEHIDFEIAIKQRGLMYMLGAGALGLLALGFLIILLIDGAPDDPDAPSLGILIAVSAAIFVVTILQFFVGMGLRKLTAFGRTGAIIFSVINLSLRFLIMLNSEQANMIFSPRYKKIIEMTPHVKRSPILLLIVVLGIIAIALFFGAMALWSWMFG